MDWCYGGRDRFSLEESGFEACRAALREAEYWVQVNFHEKARDKTKRRGEVEGSPSCKGVFTVKGD